MSSSADFDRANSEYLQSSITAISAYPYTISTWFYRDGTGTTDYVISLSSTVNSARRINLQVNASDNLTFDARQNGSTVSFSGTTTVGSGSWNYITLLSRSSTDHEIYLNGVSEATSSTDLSTLLSNDRFLVSRWALGLGSYADGKIAYPVVFARTLSVDEIKQIMYMPYSIMNGCRCYLDLLATGAVVGDYKDLSINGSDANAGTIPATSNLGPSVYFP